MSYQTEPVCGSCMSEVSLQKDNGLIHRVHNKSWQHYKDFLQGEKRLDEPLPFPLLHSHKHMRSTTQANKRKYRGVSEWPEAKITSDVE